MNNSDWQTLEEQTSKTKKAYGGCELCYGKGYSTQIVGTRISTDFEGDKEVITPHVIHMNFCTCERGKHLEGLILVEIKKAKKEERLDIKNKLTQIDEQTKELREFERKIKDLMNDLT